MPRPERTRVPADVVNIVRDKDILDEILVRWDKDGDPIVKATYLVPDLDGTIRRETRLASNNPAGFITATFNSTI